MRALCLAGPTASGKTAAALALAAEIPLEIVSVDSALVYRGMDIGTAKPTAAERAAVPHHLIDILDPAESYSAARFATDAGRLIDEIRARGRLPLLVGGTMLYFKALFEGLDTMPEADPAIRAQIDQEARARGWPALHAELARVDPETAARLAPHDSQRIQRALEVWRATGAPLSSFHSAKPKAAAGDWPLIALEPTARAWLHERIAERFDAMPAADPGVRAAIDAEAGSAGWPAMHAQLALVDPDTAARLDPNDSQRIQRALEVFRSGGVPLSTLHSRARRDAPAHDGALVALEPASRAWLHARIAQRFDAMLDAGFLDEVRGLRRNPALHLDLPSMRCVGYRQAWEALDAGDPPDLHALRERGVAATRQLAKRQITWLRGMAHRQVVEADAADVEARLLAVVESLIGPAGTLPSEPAQ